MEKDVEKVVEKDVEIFVGIDVSKVWLDIAVYEQEKTYRVANSDEGIANLVKWLKELGPRSLCWNRPVVLRCWQWQS